MKNISLLTLLVLLISPLYAVATLKKNYIDHKKNYIDKFLIHEENKSIVKVKC